MTLTAVCLAMILLTTISMILTYRTLGKLNQQTIQMQSRSQEEISRLAQSVVSATTEATTRLSRDQMKWTEVMSLGREEAHLDLINSTPNGSENDRPPIPGLETLEGLPDNIREAIQREYQEQMGIQPVLLRKPPPDFPLTPEVPITPPEWQTE